MNRWIKYIISVRAELNILLILCFIIIFIIEFIFANIPELFYGSAKVGVIVDRLCLSFVSSYIFYFVVVHLKNQKDKENIYQYIANKTYQIIGDGKSVFLALKTEAKYEFGGDYPSLNDIEEICKAVNPYGQAPLILGQLRNYANWLQFLVYYMNRTEEGIKKIYIKMQFLDSDYLKLIINIQDSTYFSIVKSLISLGAPISNTDLSAFAKNIYEYLNHVRLLEDYAERKLKDYR